MAAWNLRRILSLVDELYMGELSGSSEPLRVSDREKINQAFAVRLEVMIRIKGRFRSFDRKQLLSYL